MSAALEIGLHAAVIAVESGTPLYLAVPGESPNGATLDSLPFGPYRPADHRTLDTGLRNWVEEQTRLSLGYVEQLYTFGDVGRMHGQSQGSDSFVSVGYLALVRKPETGSGNRSLNWSNWYAHFPWEDWRCGEPELISTHIIPCLKKWCESAD